MSNKNDSATGRSRKFPKNTHLWSKQRWETKQAHSRFDMYLSMSNRSHRQVSEIVGVSEAAIQSTAARDCWGNRSKAYDAHTAEKLRENQEKALEAMRERHMKQSLLMQDLGNSRLSQMMKLLNDGKEVPINVRDAQSLIEAGAKMERLNRGEPDSITQTSSDVRMSATVETLDLRDVMKDRAAYEALKTQQQTKQENED